MYNVRSLLAEASFSCIQRAGKKIPLPRVESVCVEHAPRFLSDRTMTCTPNVCARLRGLKLRSENNTRSMHFKTSVYEVYDRGRCGRRLYQGPIRPMAEVSFLPHAEYKEKRPLLAGNSVRGSVLTSLHTVPYQVTAASRSRSMTLSDESLTFANQSVIYQKAFPPLTR